MTPPNIHEDAEVIAAAALGVTLIIALMAVVGYYVTKRTQHATDEENKPLLSDDEPITIYDNDAGTSTESMTSKIGQGVDPKVLTNALLSASPPAFPERPSTVEKPCNTPASQQKTTAEKSKSPSISPVLSGALRTASAGGAKPINVQTGSDRNGVASKAQSGLDGTADIVEFAARTADKVNGQPSSSFLDSFLPPQGFVEAMKAKLKGSAIPENSKEAKIVEEVNSKLIDLANDNDHAVKLAAAPAEANFTSGSTIHDVNLGNHTVAPPGAFPTSPKEATNAPANKFKENDTPPLERASESATAAKQTRKMTGSKLPKRRRQASKSEDTPSTKGAAPAVVVGVEQPIENVRAVGFTYAQGVGEEPSRRSSAPGLGISTQPGGNSLNRSQRRRYTRKKSNSVAAAMPQAEAPTLARKE